MARSGRGWDATPPRGRAARGRRRGPDRAESTSSSDPEAQWHLGDHTPAAPDFETDPNSEKQREQPPRDPHELAREICLRQLAVRPRTRAELAKALTKRGITEEVIRAVLDRYGEVGMIDDAAFAKAWVSSRHHGRGLASRALAQELRQRSVSQEDTEQALSDLDPDTEAQTALDLATRKLRSMRGESDAIFRRLIGMLARKGYPAGVAVRAVKEALATRDAELAELIDPDAYEGE